MPTIRLVHDDAGIEACRPVLSELRTGLQREDFVARVRRQMAQGYRLVAREVDGVPVSVAGMRVCEMLSRGRFLYVDDLVTAEARRSEGHGSALWAWLIDYARSQDCRRIDLDSGMEKTAAHRWYFARRLYLAAHHFRLDLDG